MIATEAVTVRRNGRALLDAVSLRLEAGRFTVVIGPNGAGKSTLLRVMAGDLRPDEGRVLFRDGPLDGVTPWRLACARAVLAQSTAVSLPFTAREIVRLGCDGIGRGLGRGARETLVATALAFADAGHLADRTVQTLSGGEQQRVHFARTLCQLEAGRTIESHQALLLDEPTAALDLRHQIGVLDRAASLSRQGIAVLAILHDLNLAAAYADDLVVLDGGRVVAQGAPAAVLTNARLAETFGLALRVRVAPPAPTPFVLPPGRTALPRHREPG